MNIRAIDTLTLKRYPRAANQRSLQAWDSADEYLLDAFIELAIDKKVLASGELLILNDNFGALACALVDFLPTCISDSYLSHRATQDNLRSNRLPVDNVTLLDSLARPTQIPKVALIKIPKQLALLEDQLAMLSQQVDANTRIIGAGKVTDIHNSTLKLFDQWLGTTTTSLAKKKSRLIYPQFDANKARNTYSPLVSWSLPELGFTIANHANLFSRGSLDIGARFLLDHIPTGIHGQIIDLGCGNGVLGLTALAKNPTAQVTFADESFMAVASAKLNVAQNLPERLAQTTFWVDNCLEHYPPQSAELILCNPPFHQNTAITDHIAKQMFSDAKRCLIAGGELRIVANRHLSYFHQLKGLFKTVDTIASNAKFMILSARKG